jgi:hypothetical protein
MEKLEQILTTSHKNQNVNLLDIFPTYEPETSITTTMTTVNMDIANIQFKAINAIVDFLNKQNFYGDVYHLARQHQIEANKYWISMFYPEEKSLKESEKQMKAMRDSLIDHTKRKTEELQAKLEH